MDVSVLATIAAGVGVIAGMAWLTFPREVDHFELEMAELAALTSSPGRAFAGGSDTDGAAVQSIHQGGPVSFDLIEGSGPSAPVQRDRPALFRVK